MAEHAGQSQEGPEGYRKDGCIGADKLRVGVAKQADERQDKSLQ